MIHNGDKVGVYAVGEIVQMKMRVAIDPFPDGKDIIAKEHKL